MKVGDKVEYTEGANSPIQGVVIRTIAGCELMNIDTGERTPAVRFVIRDHAGKLHTTVAMSECPKQLTGTDNRVTPDSEKSGEIGQ